MEHTRKAIGRIYKEFSPAGFPVGKSIEEREFFVTESEAYNKRDGFWSNFLLANVIGKKTGKPYWVHFSKETYADHT